MKAQKTVPSVASAAIKGFDQMNPIAIQASSLPTALYLAQAFSKSLRHNPDKVFVLVCDGDWHAQIQELVPKDHRLKLSDEFATGVADFETGLRRFFVTGDHSIPREFVTAFRHVANTLEFVCGVESERDLLFQLQHRYIGSPSRVLFVNEPNKCLSADDMAVLVQSILDKRFSIATTRPTPVRNAVCGQWPVAHYAHLAAQADYVIGPVCAQMAVTFNQASIGRVRAWITVDSRQHYPFTDRCYRVTGMNDMVAKLKELALI